MGLISGMVKLEFGLIALVFLEEQVTTTTSMPIFKTDTQIINDTFVDIQTVITGVG